MKQARQRAAVSWGSTTEPYRDTSRFSGAGREYESRGADMHCMTRANKYNQQLEKLLETTQDYRNALFGSNLPRSEGSESLLRISNLGSLLYSSYSIAKLLLPDPIQRLSSIWMGISTWN